VEIEHGIHSRGVRGKLVSGTVGGLNEFACIMSRKTFVLKAITRCSFLEVLVMSQ
jgi:hypothetical protein